MCCSGSHLNSMQMVARGEVDAAAIDSNVLGIKLRSAPELRGRLRVIETWGPFPIQPVVLRSGLHPRLKDRLRAALLAIGEDAPAPPALAGFGLQRFAPVTYGHYAPERVALQQVREGAGYPAVMGQPDLAAQSLLARSISSAAFSAAPTTWSML